MVHHVKRNPNPQQGTDYASKPSRKVLADVTNVIVPDPSKPARAKQKSSLQICDPKEQTKNTKEISKRKISENVSNISGESSSLSSKPPLVGRKVSFHVSKPSLAGIVKSNVSKQNTNPDAKKRDVSVTTRRTSRIQSCKVNNVATQINREGKHSANNQSWKSTSKVPRASLVVLRKSKSVGNRIQPTQDDKKNIIDEKPKKTNRRRRSFTSLLSEKSVLPIQHGLKLYDKRNELEVAEYADDIYQRYWIMEVERKIPSDYLSIQTEIAPKLRSIMINWLTEVHYKYELMPETLYLMVVLFDQFLSRVPIKKNELQLVGITSLLIASKYEDYWHPKIKELISLTADSYSRHDVLLMESRILKTLKFQLNSPTLYLLMLGFLKAAKCDSRVEHLSFYLIELSLADYEMLQYAPSLVCASAVYVARMTCRLGPAWTSTLAKYSTYKESQIKKCAGIILRLQKSARISNFDATYRKHAGAELGAVAKITPLDKLL